MEIVTSFETLMQYAHELGQARLSGDKDRIEEAKRSMMIMRLFALSLTELF